MAILGITSFYDAATNTPVANIAYAAFLPAGDNHMTLGNSALRLSAVYAEAFYNDDGPLTSAPSADDRLTRRTFFTTEAVTEGTTVVNLVFPTVTIDSVDYKPDQIHVNQITGTGTGGGTNVSVIIYEDDGKAVESIKWLLWDANAAPLFDDFGFDYVDADASGELHIVIDALAGGPGTYTITLVGRVYTWIAV